MKTWLLNFYCYTMSHKKSVYFTKTFLKIKYWKFNKLKSTLFPLGEFSRLYEASWTYKWIPWNFNHLFSAVRRAESYPNVSPTTFITNTKHLPFGKENFKFLCKVQMLRDLFCRILLFMLSDGGENVRNYCFGVTLLKTWVGCGSVWATSWQMLSRCHKSVTR